jgi:hypothetical protein
MQARHRKKFVAVAACLLTACGGGGGGSGVSMTDATVIGPITGFGSVMVNGIRFDDSKAVVTIEDAIQARDQLRIGMVVRVQGQVRSDGTGVANQIGYNDCVEGPITAMNQVQNTLTVFGETVQVDDDTVFDGVTLRDMNAFAIGDLIEVSCMPVREQERMRASRIERKGTFVNGSTTIELTGTAANLNLAQGTCTVGASSVDFSAIAAADLPQGLANGMTVEVSGKRFENGVLLVDRLRDRDRDRIHVPDGDLFEVEGYVANFVSISDFEVDGYKVDASSAVINNGTAADVVNGVKVEVEGTMTDGVLVAKLLVIKLQTSVRVEAGMQTKDTSLSTLTLLGRPIKVTADTVLTDRLGNSTQPQLITLAALNAGDRLEVKATSESGSLLANSVERTEADPLVVVKAAADAKTPVTGLTLTGFAVATSANTIYRDQNRNQIDATTFYNLVQVPPAVPSVVHARGVVSSLTSNVVDSTRSTSTTGELRISDD